MQQVGFDGLAESVALEPIHRGLNHFITRTILHGGEGNIVLVSNHPGQGQTLLRVGSLVIVAPIEMYIALNGTDLLEIIDAMEGRCIEAGGHGDHD